ncbi:MAG: hypothetical protein V7719_10870 [Psychroserpens sp.]|uniref:hypothetical protein n=1 Tax=Psychroserpens sp. TaxID=2020870 RepID=UPI003002C009
MKKLIVFIALSMMLSCQEETKTAKEKVAPKEVAKPELIIKLEFKTNQEDVIILELDEIIVDEFQNKKILISEKVIPTTTSEVITANFGSNTSRKFIIDLGSSQLKEFEIVSMSFEYGDKYMDITPGEIENYFVLSKFTVLDKTSHKITTQKVDNYHFPKLYARGLLWDRLLK